MPERKKTVSAIIATACCMLLALAVVSCSTLGLSGDEKDKEALKASIEAFNQAFRWEDYNSASVFVPSGGKMRFWQEVDLFKGKIKIIDYQIRDIDHIEKSGVATAILHFQYYRPEVSTLQKVSFSQKWLFSEKDKGWILGQSGFEAMTKRSGACRSPRAFQLSVKETKITG